MESQSKSSDRATYSQRLRYSYRPVFGWATRRGVHCEVPGGGIDGGWIVSTEGDAATVTGSLRLGSQQAGKNRKGENQGQRRAHGVIPVSQFDRFRSTRRTPQCTAHCDQIRPSPCIKTGQGTRCRGPWRVSVAAQGAYDFRRVAGSRFCRTHHSP